MPDKKLTDNEIVKALECCADINDKCPECPLKDKNRESCVGILMSNALDLINRLQSENKNLMAEVEKQKKKVEMRNIFIEKQKAENERLKAKVNHYNYCYENFVNTPSSRIKAEAYKEFAELLRLAIVNKPSEFKASQATVDFLNGSAYRQQEILDEIELTLKELVDNNG